MSKRSAGRVTPKGRSRIIEAEGLFYADDPGVTMTVRSTEVRLPSRSWGRAGGSGMPGLVFGRVYRKDEKRDAYCVWVAARESDCQWHEDGGFWTVRPYCIVYRAQASVFLNDCGYYVYS